MRFRAYQVNSQTNAFVVQMPDGGKYSFPQLGTSGAAEGLDTSGQGILVMPANGGSSITLKNGTQITPDPATSSNSSRVTDTNGNAISFTPNSITDSIGRAVTVSAADATDGAPATLAFHYPVSNGTATVTVQFVTTTYNCPQNDQAVNTHAPMGASGTYSMPSAVILPNGLTYAFHYDGCGHIDKVTYPSGGYSRYVYTLLPTGIYEPNTSGSSQSQVTEKYVCPGIGTNPGVTTVPSGGDSCQVAEELTKYSRTTAPTLVNNSKNIVTDAVWNDTVYQFTQGGLGSGQIFLPPVETSRAIYTGNLSDGSAQLEKTITTAYTPYAAGNYYPLLPVRQTITLSNGQVAKTEWDYSYQQIFNGISAMKEKREFDFGVGSPGALLRKTVYDWLQLSSPMDRPTEYKAPFGSTTSSRTFWIMDRETERDHL